MALASGYNSQVSFGTPFIARNQPMTSPSHRLPRRQFIASSAAVAMLAAAPAVHTQAKTLKPLIVGEGEHQFEVEHEWPQLPAKYTWQTTHNVAVDKAGNLYVIHEGRENQKDHPSIFVFDSEGKFIRAFGEQFQGGGHGI
jgi:hypothetical protein